MGVRLKVLVGLLAVGLVVSSLPRIASHAEPAAVVVNSPTFQASGSTPR